jgi:hypothetical protein
MNVRLKITQNPNIKGQDATRTVLSTFPVGSLESQERPVLRGKAECPTYVCGKCGNPLVQGIPAKNFIDNSRPLESVGATILPLDFPAGTYPLGSTLELGAPTVSLVSYNGPFILECPACHSENEMIAPNMIFDEPS